MFLSVNFINRDHISFWIVGGVLVFHNHSQGIINGEHSETVETISITWFSNTQSES